MDADSLIIYRKTNDIYEDIAEDVDTRFDTSNYELNRPDASKIKGQESYWCKERQTRWRNHEKICWIKSKILQLLNRWQ